MRSQLFKLSAGALSALLAAPVSAAGPRAIKGAVSPARAVGAVVQVPAKLPIPATTLSPEMATISPLPATAIGAVAPLASPAAKASPLATPAPLAARIQAAADQVSAASENLSRRGGSENASGAGRRIQKALDGSGGDILPPGPVDPSGGDGGSGDREQMLRLRALKQIADVFDAHYAPKEWKASARDVDVKREYEKARAKIEAAPKMSRRQFQRVLSDFVNAAQDYHVGISFYSSESARLPVSIVGAEGKYYIGSVDRDELPESKFPFQPGDEVVEFGGRPTAEVVQSFLRAPNRPETDARLAEIQLTARSARRALPVPQGDIVLKIKTADGNVHETPLTWSYRPELIASDVPTQGTIVTPEIDDSIGGELSAPDPRKSGKMRKARELVRALLSPMAHPDAKAMAQEAAADDANRFAMGAKTSFVPRLGEVLWEPPPQVAEQIPFDTYIYKDAAGRRIGYIRVPDYVADDNPEEASIIFARIIATFEQQTDGLVIDQVNNPGGSVAYMYQLLSFLATKPLKVPPHKILLSEGQARMAADIIEQSQAEEDMADLLEEAFAEQMLGLPFAPIKNPIVAFAEFILEQFSVKKKRLSDEVALFGMGKIPVNPQVSYTKPILVLINELDFSGGDFFPAILQSNKRAKLFGVNSAGAGGAVQEFAWPNELGIERMTYTWTFALRAKGRPIENLGVAPEHPYQITAKDLRDGFKDYAAAVNAALDTLFAPPAGAP